MAARNLGASGRVLAPRGPQQRIRRGLIIFVGVVYDAIIVVFVPRQPPCEARPWMSGVRPTRQNIRRSRYQHDHPSSSRVERRARQRSSKRVQGVAAEEVPSCHERMMVMGPRAVGSQRNSRIKGAPAASDAASGCWYPKILSLPKDIIDSTYIRAWYGRCGQGARHDVLDVRKVEWQELAAGVRFNGGGSM